MGQVDVKEIHNCQNPERTFTQMLKRPLLKYFTLITGNTLGHDVGIERKLQELRPRLQKVQKLENCDFVLVFCPVVSRAGTDIEAAVKTLSTLPGNKPAVLLVLHHTFNLECVVQDSSRNVNRENTLTVDCLFHEAQGLLPCSQNKEALDKVGNWTVPQETSIGNRRPFRLQQPITLLKQKVNRPLQKYFTITTENTPRQYESIERMIQANACLQKESTAAACDFFLVFCTRNDVEEAQHKLSIQSAATKPAVMLVLHHPAYFVSESTIIVNFLLCEGEQELLRCSHNDEALSTVANCLSKGIRNEGSSSYEPMLQHPLHKYFTATTGNTPIHYETINKLHEVSPFLQEVHTAEMCDFILVFCTANDAEAAQAMLSHQPANKSAIVIVLHTECTVIDCIEPDIRKTVERANTIKVNWFFSEHEELLPCSENRKALSEIVNWLLREEEHKKTKGPSLPVWKTSNQAKYFTYLAGTTLNAHVDFLKILCKRVSGLQEVQSVEQCDVILVFSPIVSHAEIDIKAALEKLTDLHATKPAVLVVLHHTFDPNCVVPDSRRAVNRENMIAVDCLFYEDQGLLQCTKNNDAYTQVSSWIEAQILPKTQTGLTRKEERPSFLENKIREVFNKKKDV